RSSLQNVSTRPTRRGATLHASTPSASAPSGSHWRNEDLSRLEYTWQRRGERSTPCAASLSSRTCRRYRRNRIDQIPRRKYQRRLRRYLPGILRAHTSKEKFRKLRPIPPTQREPTQRGRDNEDLHVPRTSRHLRAMATCRLPGRSPHPYPPAASLG